MMLDKFTRRFFSFYFSFGNRVFIIGQLNIILNKFLNRFHLWSERKKKISGVKDIIFFLLSEVKKKIKKG